MNNNYSSLDLFEENYNTSCYKFFTQYSYFEIKDFEDNVQKIKDGIIKPFKLYSNRIEQKFKNKVEYIVKGEFKYVQSKMRKEIQQHSSKYGYLWFTYCDMLKQDFEQAREKVTNAKLFFNNQYFDIKEMKEVQGKIYSNLIALWEKNIK